MARVILKLWLVKPWPKSFFKLQKWSNPGPLHPSNYRTFLSGEPGSLFAIFLWFSIIVWFERSSRDSDYYTVLGQTDHALTCIFNRTRFLVVIHVQDGDVRVVVINHGLINYKGLCGRCLSVIGPEPHTPLTHCIRVYRRLEEQQFTKLGRKYLNGWLYLQSINYNKDLPQSPLQVNFFLDGDILLSFLYS